MTLYENGTESPLSGNAMVRAKQEGERAYHALVENDATAAQRLKTLAASIYRETVHVENVREQSRIKVGEWIGDAYATLGNSHNSFTAWWDDPKTWEEASGLAGMPAPFSRRKASDYKRIGDFCAGSLPGKGNGRPKNAEGFTDEAMVELTAPKYVKDRHARELNADDGERTPESSQRLDVVESVYGRLKERFKKRKAAASKSGEEPRLITKREVVDALQEAFRDANLRVVNRGVRRTSLKDLLDQIDRHMNGWYFTFQGDAAAVQAVRDKVAECLAEWDQWEAEL
jgi:hypothetical protein